MPHLSRRTFLSTGLATAAGLTLYSPAAARTERALRDTARRTVAPAGTTLDTVATPQGATGYRRLTAGPGWPLVTRTELAPANPTRDDRRTALASFVQFTDLHLVDSQSPARFEYLHPFEGAAFRPHETLATQGCAALVRRVNGLTAGPCTGRRPDFVICTGDNTDNHEHVELDWYLRLLSGGTVTPNTGDPHAYEGVQNSGATLYWNPDDALRDDYKATGFPQLPGFLHAAIQPHHSPGLNIPWYAVFGNHDDSVEGVLPGNIPVLDALYTGMVKIEGAASPDEAKRLAVLLRDHPAEAALALPRALGPIRIVTPDTRRKPFTPNEFIAAHLPADVTGPGPAGHGFTAANVAGDTGYYTFPIAPGITGISMDSTNRAGFTDGSLGTAQLRWIERVLTAGSSRYHDASGAPVRQDTDDTYFVLFSHHTSASMDNTVRDPLRLLEDRHTGAELVALLQRFPNVLAWVNGHTHRNAITPHHGPTPQQSFWEINTASHTDFPQHARVIEIAGNGDGTLSLFTTLLEADSPYQADYAGTGPAALASLYRELAFNDIHADPARLGAAGDHNTELLLADPLR